MSIKEDIIKYINNNYQNRITNDAYIYLYLSDLEKLGYTRNAVIKELNILSSQLPRPVEVGACNCPVV